MAEYNYLDYNGVLYLKQKFDALYAKASAVPTKTSELQNDSKFQTDSDVSSAIQTALESLTIPSKTSDLTNDSQFQSLSDVTNLINDAIADITGISFEVVTELPATGKTGTIYLLPKTTALTQNTYDEYIYYNNNWELIGSTDVDLSDFIRSSDMVPITNAQIDTIFAD